MATAKLVRARRNADTARRIKNNWKKQFFEMRDQRDVLRRQLKELKAGQVSSPHSTLSQPESNCPKSLTDPYDTIEQQDFIQKGK